MKALLKRNPFKPQPGSSLLGLAFDGSRLEGAVVRRTNGSVEVTGSVSASLSLELLTNDPELVGREIRKHLDAAGVRERWCVVGLPLGWAFTLNVKLPDLTAPDLESFLQIEAERGFPQSPEALMLAHSEYRTPGGERCATLVGVPREHLSRLESVLRAAQLRPVSFSFALPALGRLEAAPTRGTISLLPGETGVGLQLASGGGVVVLRTVESAHELEGGETLVQSAQVAREIRITLGQLPEDVRAAVRAVRVFGRGDMAEALAEQLRPRLASFGLEVERVREYAASELGVRVPAGTEVTAAFSLAVRHLTGRGPVFEMMLPKVSAWQQFAARYSSRKLMWAVAPAAVLAAAVGLAFLIQQWQIVRWRAQWAAMEKRVTTLEGMQQNIRKYRPWFDESFRSLSILRRLTESFPTDGSVSAKTVEIRDGTATRELPRVTCTGTARNNQALLQTVDKLSAARGVTDVQVEQIRGKSPLEFTLNFHWGEIGVP